MRGLYDPTCFYQPRAQDDSSKACDQQYDDATECFGLAHPSLDGHQGQSSWGSIRQARTPWVVHQRSRLTVRRHGRHA